MTEPVIPSENWFRLISAEPIYKDGVLTTKVNFTDDRLPTSEIGKTDYYAHVQPLSSSGLPMFSAKTYFTASFGDRTVIVIETRVLPENPSYVYVTIQKDVPDIPFATPYASNRLTRVPVNTPTPPDPPVPPTDLEKRVMYLEMEVKKIKNFLDSWSTY